MLNVNFPMCFIYFNRRRFLTAAAVALPSYTVINMSLEQSVVKWK